MERLYQQEETPAYQATQRWKFFIPVSFLLHLTLIFSIERQQTTPIPKRTKLNKPITLIVQTASVPSKQSPAKAIVVQTQQEKALPVPKLKPVSQRVFAKKTPALKTVQPQIETIQAYRKVLVVKPVLVKKSPPARVRPAAVAATNIPDDISKIARIGIAIPAQPMPVIAANQPSEMDNPRSIGIPLTASTPVPAIPVPHPVQRPPEPIRKFVSAPAPTLRPTQMPFQAVRKPVPPPIVPQPPIVKTLKAEPMPERVLSKPPIKTEMPTSPPIKPVAEPVKPAAVESHLEALEESNFAFVPVLPRVVMLLSQSFLKKLVEVFVPTSTPTAMSIAPSKPLLPAPTIELHATEDNAQDNANKPPRPAKNNAVIPEKFMTNDWHTKEVIQDSMDKERLHEEQQEKLRKHSASIIFKEKKDYGSVPSQGNLPPTAGEKSKSGDFGLPVGDCYVGFKGSDEEKRALNCNY